MRLYVYVYIKFTCYDLFPLCDFFVIIECLDDQRQRTILIHFTHSPRGIRWRERQS